MAWYLAGSQLRCAASTSARSSAQPNLTIEVRFAKDQAALASRPFEQRIVAASDDEWLGWRAYAVVPRSATGRGFRSTAQPLLIINAVPVEVRFLRKRVAVRPGVAQ